MAQRLDQRAEVGLRRQPAHRVHRGVNGVAPGFYRLENARRTDAARVVRVEMEGHTPVALEGGKERARCPRLAQARHVLDRNDVGAGALELPGRFHVIPERIFTFGRVEQVSGIANGGLDDLAGLAYRVNGYPHVVDPVQ